MFVILYSGNLDAPITEFRSNLRVNNWYGIRSTNNTAGFRFFIHDAEHTLLDVNEDRNGPFPAGDPVSSDGLSVSSPQYLWQQLQANADFRLRVADHIQRHFFNSGALTPEACLERFNARRNEIDRAVVGESARWGRRQARAGVHAERRMGRADFQRSAQLPAATLRHRPRSTSRARLVSGHGRTALQSTRRQRAAGI